MKQKTYITVYSKTSGKRLTSYVTGIHGENVKQLEILAMTEYPEEIYKQETSEEWGRAIRENLSYINNEYTKPKPPSEEEIREEKLQKLDNEYEEKFKEIDNEIVKAFALGDDTTRSELIETRNQMKSEYEKKRSEI